MNRIKLLCEWIAAQRNPDEISNCKPCSNDVCRALYFPTYGWHIVFRFDVDIVVFVIFYNASDGGSSENRHLKKTFNNGNGYDQTANFVYTPSEINNAIKDEFSFEYFGELLKQCGRGDIKYGGITYIKILKENMWQNCIPESVFDMSIEYYALCGYRVAMKRV